LLLGNLFFMAFTALSAIPMMSNGLKEFTFYNLIVSAVALMSTVALVHRWGVSGIAVGQCVAAITGFFLIRHWLKRHFRVRFEWSKSALFLLCACEMAIVVALAVRLVQAPAAQVCVGIVVGVVTYVAALFLQRGVTRQELQMMLRRSHTAAA
jgi:O-antigen/teichoic acid export membrane protein